MFAQATGRRGEALDSIVSPGCILSGGRVNRCVLSPEVRVNSFAGVEESILLRGVQVGRHSRIRRAIIDKYVDIPPNEVIGYDLAKDSERYFVTDSGIVVIEHPGQRAPLTANIQRRDLASA